MPALTMFEVTPDHPVPISPQGGTATVTVLSGDTLYYADTPQVSAAHNQGSVTAGNVQSFTNPAWVRSASLSTVLAQVTAATVPPGSAVLGSDGTVGGPGGTPLAPSVESVPSGAVPHIFQAAKYGIKADAVVDPDGNPVSGTDDTAAWLSLIADLPADKTVIRLHGISLLSNPNALSFSLGFNTSRLTMVGDGPHTGFALADNSNCDLLRFNTSGLGVGAPVLDLLRLSRFAIYGNGYNQSDGGGIVGGLIAYAVKKFRLDGVDFFTCRSVAASVTGFRDAAAHACTVDTIVNGGAANGINFQNSTTLGWQARRPRITDCDFIDVPNQSLYGAGTGIESIAAHGNTVSYRNLRPQPASVPSWVTQWKNATQAAPAYSAATDYTVGQWVSSGGFNYLAVQANGPGSTVVAPGSNQFYWWLQNKPLRWSAATAYVLGQCVIYTPPTNPGTEAAWSNLTNYAVNAAVLSGGVPYVAVAASGPGNGGAVAPGTNPGVWQPSRIVPAGLALNFTALAASTNVAPTTANGTLMPQWQIGGPQFAQGANGVCFETKEYAPSSNGTIMGNPCSGRNAAGELVGNAAILIYNTSGNPGVGMIGVAVSGNPITGFDNGMILQGVSAAAVQGNPMKDVTNGIIYGDLLPHTERQLLLDANPIQLGGRGNGKGISISKSGLNSSLIGLDIGPHDIDGGFSIMALTSALTNAGGPYTSIPVTPLEKPLPAGSMLLIGGLIAPSHFSGPVVVTVSANTTAGAMSIPVNSFTPAASLNSGTPVFPIVTILTGALASGAQITALSVSPLPVALQAGQWLALCAPTNLGVNQVQVAAQGAALGATSVPLNAVTPSFAYPAGSTPTAVAVLGSLGLTMQGGLSQFSVARVKARYVTGDPLQLLVSTGTPQDGVLLECRGDYCGGALHAGAVGTSIPVRIEGGGWTNNLGVATLPTSGVQVRRVYGVTPAANIVAPAVPATGVAATMPIYDGFLLVTGAAGGPTTIALGTTTQSAFDTATITVPASATVLIPVLAGQKVQPTYGAGNAPTWTFIAQ